MRADRDNHQQSLTLPPISARRNERKWVFLLILLGTCLFSWPSLINRGPFFIADTSAYVRSADAAFSTLLSYRSIWSDKRDIYVNTVTEHDEVAPKGQLKTPIHPPLMGRSIYYGAFIYAPVVIAGEHAAVFLQSAVGAVLVWLALSPFIQGRTCRRAAIYISTCAVLAALTPLPFMTSLVVPDFLTGVGCASLILLLCLWKAYSWQNRAVLIGMIFLAALSHSSNLPLFLLLGGASILIKITGIPLELRGVYVGFAAVVLALIGDVAFSAAVKYNTGIEPIRPPFLTARLIADGPGFNLVRDKCPQANFEVCNYIGRMPYDSDLFLWSEDERNGVFSSVDHSSQRKLSSQDASFAISTALNYPLLTAGSTIKAAGRQLTIFNYDIWRGKRGNPKSSLKNLPKPVAERMAGTLNARGAMPVLPFQMLGAAVALGSLLAALLFLREAWRSEDPMVRSVGLAILLVLTALVANAVIAGGLSKPDARYNLRVLWILPLFLVLYLIARSNRSKVQSIENFAPD